MSQKFDWVCAFILNEEGGLVDDKRDPGGVTKYGIAQRFHPDVDVRNLTEADAKAIYAAEYWAPTRCEMLPLSVALLVMNASVNPGVSAATRFLQTSIGLVCDGVIGPQTLAALAGVASMSEPDIVNLCAKFAAEHAMRIATDDQFSIYGRGWLRRLSRALILSGKFSTE